jgi:hypothetical protein
VVQPSIDPELMIRMLIVGYCYGIRFERRLYEEVELHLAYRWFCRLDRWVHSERLVHKLDAFTDENRTAQATVRKLIWNFYRDLKAYRCTPTKQRKAALRARFDRIFKRKTGFVTLDRLLARLNANKPELLMVLDRPEIPLHTNGSKNDIRCDVTRRKVSAGTRSDIGRDCRDAFLGLAKTCAKLEIAFWDYLGDRLAIPGTHTVPRLPEIILVRAQSP